MWNASSKIEVKAEAKLNENDTQQKYDFLHIYCVCVCFPTHCKRTIFFYHNKYDSSIANDFQIKSRSSRMCPVLCSSFRCCVVVS